jgi:hypothetical protein
MQSVGLGGKAGNKLVVIVNIQSGENTVSGTSTILAMGLS